MRVMWLVPVPPGPLARAVNEERASSGSWHVALEHVVTGIAGLELHVVAGVRADTLIEESGVTYHGIETPVPPVPARVWRNWTCTSIDGPSWSRVLELIDEIGPDVVHVHGTERGYSEIIGRIGVPCVLSIQGLLTVAERMHPRALAAGRAEWFDARHVLAGSSPVHERRCMRVRSTREREVLGRAEWIMGRTEWDRAVTSILAPQAKYMHCDEALRGEFLSRRWKGPGPGPAVAYSTVGPSVLKGVETLVESIAHSERRGHSVELRIGGLDSTTAVGRAAQHVAARLGVASRLRLLGKLTAGEIACELEKCGVYLCASHIENSSNALCEALAMGVPAVVTAVGGTPSLVTDRQDALVVQDGDSWHMAACIARILETPGMAAELGSSALARGRVRHDPDRIRDQIGDAYRRMVGVDDVGGLSRKRTRQDGV